MANKDWYKNKRGIVDVFNGSNGYIKCDDGDLYIFVSNVSFTKGDSVIFDAIEDSQMAWLGTPEAENVRKV